MRAATITIHKVLPSLTSPAEIDFWAEAEFKNRTTFSTRAEIENRLRCRFGRVLTERIQYSLRNTVLIDPTSEDIAKAKRVPITPTLLRIRFYVSEIQYGSLILGLDIPDPDALLDIVGNNVDLISVLLRDYVPEAFEAATDASADQFEFNVRPSSDLTAYAQTRSAGAPAVIDPRDSGASKDAKHLGGRALAQIVSSPLILPVLLMVFLWYVTRQDMLADKQLAHSLLQSTVQQQVTITETLKDMVRPKVDAVDSSSMTKPAASADAGRRNTK